MVKSEGAKENFIKAVTVCIANGKVVVTLTNVFVVAFVHCVEAQCLCKGAVLIGISGNNCSAGALACSAAVVTALCYQMGCYTVKVCHAGVVTLTAVACIITENDCAGLVVLGVVGNTCYLFACCTFKMLKKRGPSMFLPHHTFV